jgi:hypothetical protein
MAAKAEKETLLKYLIALVAGYYVLEAGRHFVKQTSKWDAEERALPLPYKLVLWLIIIATCLAWPILVIVGKPACSKG